MGLDVIALRNLKVSDADADNSTRFWDNPDFPGRAAGLDCTKRYEYAAAEDFLDVIGISYGGYNNWRNWLAVQAGYEGGAEEAWKATSGPFWELINFADNEGTIGPVACAKLALDFIAYADKVQGDELSMQRYKAFAEAFAFVGAQGAVKFM